MSNPAIVSSLPTRNACSEAEWHARVDLAACYRLVALYGMSDMTANHISMRVPGEEGAFLINPYGMLYEEITASSLVKIDYIGYHDYQGVVLDQSEQESLIRDLGGNNALILRNHGLLTVGRTIPEAFNAMHRLELSCRTQLAAMACGEKLRQVPEDVVEKTYLNYQPQTRRPFGVMEWPALLRKLDRLDPG